jgi:predicted lipid-binding transport protein (Tim44 family)
MIPYRHSATDSDWFNETLYAPASRHQPATTPQVVSLEACQGRTCVRATVPANSSMGVFAGGVAFGLALAGIVPMAVGLVGAGAAALLSQRR